MFESLIFWVTVATTAAAWQLLPARAVLGRTLVVAAASALVIALTLNLSVVNWLLLTSSVAWYVIALRLIHGRRQFALALIACAPLLVTWGTGKALILETSAATKFLLFAGLSFLLIKAFTLAKDVSDGRIDPPSAPRVVAYLFFFPTYVAGPMHYYPEFSRQLETPTPVRSADIFPIAFRFVSGLFKVRVIVVLLKPMSLAGLDGVQSVSPGRLIVASVVYSFVILFDFSGYTDMAIASARLMGVSTPENFNWPYLARNIRNFWQRWHITFSRVLTGYLFIPLTRFLQPRLGRSRAGLASTAYVATFLFCGYWHGSGANFLAWGLYHATGLIVYDQYLARRKPTVAAAASAANRSTAQLASSAASIAVTFLFVSLGWVFFVLPLPRLAQLMR